jgi:TDG/mug DNA glycosylase family protein
VTRGPVVDRGAPEALPRKLVDVHRALAVGDPLELSVPRGAWPEARLVDVAVGAGFTAVSRAPADAPRRDWVVRGERDRTLPDTVGPDMTVLVGGLNPSVYSADAGVGFARPGNRFWPAALAAGLVSIDRDPRHALDAHGVGMTDLVKRATRRADALTAEEYAVGLGRVERLAAWLRPRVICLVGLAGWRAVADRRAVAGPQPHDLGGVRVYLMPSTSGLNAHADLATLTDHLRAAARLAR